MNITTSDMNTTTSEMNITTSYHRLVHIPIPCLPPSVYNTGGPRCGIEWRSHVGPPHPLCAPSALVWSSACGWPQHFLPHLVRGGHVVAAGWHIWLGHSLRGCGGGALRLSVLMRCDDCCLSLSCSCRLLRRPLR